MILRTFFGPLRSPGLALAILAISFIWLFPGQSHAEGYTLEQALRDGYARDPRIRAAQSALASAREGARQATGLSYPSISGFGTSSATDTKNFNDQGTLQQNGLRSSVGLEVNQQIYSFGRFRARRSRAAAAVTAAQSELKDITLRVYFEVGSAFAAARLAENILATYEAHYANMLALYEASEAKFQADLTTVTNVRLVMSKMEQANAERVNAASNLRAAIDLLARLTNRDIDLLDESGLALFLESNVPAKTEAIITALDLSPVIHIARANELAAQAEMNLTASELWPSLGVRGRTSRGVTDGQLIGSDEIALVLSIPLWDGGIQRSRARAGRHQYEQSRQNLRNAQDRVRDNVTTAWHRIRGTSESLAAWRRAVAVEEKTIEGIQEEVDEGLRPITHLLEAKEDMVITSTRAFSTEHDAVVAILRLEMEMGILDQRVANSP